MSHITKMKLRVRDLDALETAATECGLELVRDARSFKWFGRFVGDTTPPAGYDPKDYGKCEHKMRLKGASSSDYEIGIVAAKDGDGYDLLVDTWQQRRLMGAVGGAEMNKLRQEYATAVTMTRAAKLARQGYTARRENVNGRVRIHLVKR